MKLPRANSRWLETGSLQRVFNALETAGGEVRVNGGAGRNSLMGMKVSDVDLSTTLVPADTMKALEAAGIKALPTGFDHGTVTAVADSTGYEITTLREDVETDGRHAVVAFGTDWEADAKRRDLTMNALYCSRDGEVFDPLGGLEDLKSKTVRFIGEAEERIREDYLRILRFFRFFAWYGGGRPDPDGLKACARLKDGLGQVAVERIWMEMRKLLSAPDPSRALLWMRTTGVLNIVLPESEKWGIDLIPALIGSEEKYRLAPDALLRLEAMVRPHGETVTLMARRLRLSNAETQRLQGWAMSGTPSADTTTDELTALLYAGDRQGIADALRLELARLHGKGDEQRDQARQVLALVRFEKKWKRPAFPLAGKDLLEKGHEAGPELGKLLGRLEREWISSGFALSKDELLTRAEEA